MADFDSQKTADLVANCNDPSKCTNSRRGFFFSVEAACFEKPNTKKFTICYPPKITNMDPQSGGLIDEFPFQPVVFLLLPCSFFCIC